MASSLYQIERLDEKNYDSWKLQIKSVLIHSELWSYVSGAEVKPDNGSAATWSNKDEKALATILLCVKPSQLNYIKNCKTSNEAWIILQNTHQPQGPARKVTLFKQLLQLKMQENTHVLPHLNNFSSLVEKLKEISIELKDELLSIILLSSLPNSFENFVLAFEARDTLPTCENLKIKLLEEGHRREGIESNSIAPEQALFVRNRRQKQSPQQSQQQQPRGRTDQHSFRGTCFN